MIEARWKRFVLVSLITGILQNSFAIADCSKCVRNARLGSAKLRRQWRNRAERRTCRRCAIFGACKTKDGLKRLTQQSHVFVSVPKHYSLKFSATKNNLELMVPINTRTNDKNIQWRKSCRNNGRLVHLITRRQWQAHFHLQLATIFTIGDHPATILFEIGRH